MYVAPDGSPDVEKETLCAVPDTSVAVMALVTDDPGVTDLAPPFEREKSNETEGRMFTVRVTAADVVMFPAASYALAVQE